MWESVKTFLLGMALPLLKEKGKEWAIEELQKLHDKNRKLYVWVLLGGYVVDDMLEDVAAKTEAKWDDDAVALLKEVLLESGSANGIELPSLEAPTPETPATPE